MIIKRPGLLILAIFCFCIFSTIQLKKYSDMREEYRKVKIDYMMNLQKQTQLLSDIQTLQKEQIFLLRNKKNILENYELAKKWKKLIERSRENER